MRKEIDVTITDDGRDEGKTFHIKEMPATRAEKWAMRALLAVARSGIDLPDDFTSMGMQGIAIMGIKAITKIAFDEAEPLLDEMMECVTFKPNLENPAIVRPLFEGDIEEIATLIQLRQEVINLHIGFFTKGGQSKSTSNLPSPVSSSSNTETSPGPSVRFSQRAKPRSGN
ncbi:hypothetical protein MesoLj131c_61940 [Mesorhizobium sp. 131-3-5]|uniref:hypothetical protein n=1 Tax=Mesorhizobium sp. 131-3-5 TaxID=2744520 RepID=UPI0019273B1D|nr:hypothetical protein [Mesorhizobium sp. 131-3-5]BCH11936.1 hypothetical protein MesoLj131c_61940 [Mesorhizobium sp. 131-3-5]